MSKTIPSPDHNAHPSVKRGKAWCLSAGKYIFEQYTNDDVLYGKSRLPLMQENRDFARGQESNDRYKKLLGKNTAEDKRSLEAKVYNNVNWNRMSPLPKYKHIVVNKFMAIDHRVEIDAIDKDAIQSKKVKKWATKVNQELEKLPGVALSQGVTTLRANDDQERNIIEKLGGFKLAGEIVHKKLSIANFYHSDWSEIKRKMYGDAFENNVMACKDYTDATTGMSKVRYVDPLRSGCSHNRATGHNKSEYFYEFIDYTVSELKLMGVKKTPDEWKEMAQNHSDYQNNNVYINQEHVSSTDSKVLNYAYDKCVVPCMEFEIVTVDTDYYTIKKDGDDEKVYEENKAKSYDTPKRKTEKDVYKNIYKGTWLIGTDDIVDFGQQYDIPRPLENECKPSYHFYSIAGPSIVEMAKSDVMDIRLAGIKLEGMIAAAANPGIAVEWSALQGMDMGAGNVKPLEMFRLRTSTGNFIFNQGQKTGIFGAKQMGGSGMPFKELQGGIGSAGREMIDIIAVKLQSIGNLTGINEIVDGSSPNPETTARQAMLAADSSNNALGSLHAAYKWIKKETAENLALRTQLAVTSSGKAYSAYYPIADSSGLKAIELTKDMTLKQMGVMVKVLPTATDIQEYKEAALNAVGTGSIDMSEYLVLIEFIKEGRTEEAMVFISHREAMKAQRDAQQQQQAIKMQGDQQAQLQEMKANQDQQADMRKLEIAKQEMMIEIQKEKQLSDIRVEEQLEIKQGELQLERSLGVDKTSL